MMTMKDDVAAIIINKIVKILLLPFFWWHYRSTYAVVSNTLAYIKIAARLSQMSPRRVPRFELKAPKLYHLILKRSRSLKARCAYDYFHPERVWSQERGWFYFRKNNRYN